MTDFAQKSIKMFLKCHVGSCTQGFVLFSIVSLDIPPCPLFFISTTVPVFYLFADRHSPDQSVLCVLTRMNVESYPCVNCTAVVRIVSTIETLEYYTRLCYCGSPMRRMRATENDARGAGIVCCWPNVLEDIVENRCYVRMLCSHARVYVCTYSGAPFWYCAEGKIMIKKKK